MARDTRWQRWSILLLLGLSLLTRLVVLQREGLWMDEAYSLHLALQSPSQIIAETALDNHPPLYYLLLHGWLSLLTPSALAARLFSILIALLATVLAIRLARDVAGQRAALFTGLLLALSPFWVYYSQEIRQYALLGLCALLATWGLWRMRDGEGNPRAGVVAFVVGSAAALYTMYVGGLVVFGLVVSGLLLCRRRRWLLVGSIAAIALAFVPWLPVLHQQVSRLHEIIQPSASIMKLLATPLVWVAGYTQARLMTAGSSVGAHLFVLAAAIVVLILLAAALLPLRRGERRTPLALLLPPIIIPPLVLWLVSQYKPMYLTYVLLPSGLLLFVAAAVGLAALCRNGNPKTKWQGLAHAAPLAIILLFFTLSLGLYWSSPAYSRGQTQREWADFLQANARPGDVLLLQNEWLYLPARVYFDLERKPWPWPTYLLGKPHVAPESAIWPPVADVGDPEGLKSALHESNPRRLIVAQLRGLEVLKVPAGALTTVIEGSAHSPEVVISIVEPPQRLLGGEADVHRHARPYPPVARP
ncbi:MAG: glycosyltransferase family 39 protein [Armatimonadota bacterium]